MGQGYMGQHQWVPEKNNHPDYFSTGGPYGLDFEDEDKISVRELVPGLDEFFKKVPGLPERNALWSPFRCVRVLVPNPNFPSFDKGLK